MSWTMIARIDAVKDKNDEYWRQKLSKDQYRVLREKGTEAPFSGKYLSHDKSGVYKCAACGAKLFHSDTKFDAPYPNQGWPSFYQSVVDKAVQLKPDNKFGMRRTEAICSNCGSHLGHVFDDGHKDQNNGMHYCVNSVALDFEEEK